VILSITFFFPEVLPQETNGIKAFKVHGKVCNGQVKTVNLLLFLFSSSLLWLV